jgi:hypothetical protein
MKKSKGPRAVLAALALAMLTVPQTASAHPTIHEQWRETWRDSSGACSVVGVKQAHTWHQVNQHSCGFQVQFAQYQEYYKVRYLGGPGDFCFSEGYHYSARGVRTFEKFYGYDIWHWCNYGGGTNVYLTIDSWAYVIFPGYGWYGNPVRPITLHCHCP